MKWVIPMYGLPREVTEKRQVEVELEEGAGMAEVLAAMADQAPELVGKVIIPDGSGKKRLADEFKFNINGTFYYAGMDFRLKRGDRIALLVPVTGG
ncbi:MAG: MoaD/ThiS family protein [Dehalococcoidales bacterium]|nr:MoaD/ThiS family protein [Dehalococcoidales bacterium]